MSTLEHIYSYSHRLPYTLWPIVNERPVPFPRGFVERLRKAFSVEMKAESPGRKGNSSPERGRKGLAGGAMKETVARSKVPNVDSIFFKSLKGFSRGWSSGPMAACGNQ